MKSVSRH